MKIKKFLAMIVALIMSVVSLGAFTSCGEEEGNDYDPNKANLTVATYNGGVGRAWLDDAIYRFEQLHAESTHFQEGRKGVKISLAADKIAIEESTSALIESATYSKSTSLSSIFLRSKQ